MDVFRRISELLSEGESFVLAVIVSRSGSAPRTVGARMVVRKDGSIVGTIGGGILEATVMDIAKSVYIDKLPVLRKFVFTAEDAAGIGMICGGQVEVLVHFVEYSKPSGVRFYQEILETIRSRKRGWIITELPSTTKLTTSHRRRNRFACASIIPLISFLYFDLSDWQRGACTAGPRLEFKSRN